MRRKWIEEEIQYLKDNYKFYNVVELAKYLNRTVDAVNRRMYLLKLSKCKKWSVKEVVYLKVNYEFKSNRELSKELNRSEVSIYNKSKKLNLYKDSVFLKNYLTSVNKSNRRDLNIISVSKIAKRFKTRSSFEKDDGSAYTWCVKNKCLNEVCSHMIPQRYSTPQLICKYIFDILLGEECEYNTKKVIKPYELDLYYPNHGLAIEYNGKHWHSDDDNTKLKIEMCEDLGIKLLILHEAGTDYENDIKNDIIEYLPHINECLNIDITENDIEGIVISDDIFDSLIDIESIDIIVSSYKLYSNFYKNNKNLAKKLIRLGLIDKYTSHMIKENQVSWNLKKITSEVKRYNNIYDIRTKSKGCYEYIRRNKLQYLYVEYKYKTRFDKLYKLPEF